MQRRLTRGSAIWTGALLASAARTRASAADAYTLRVSIPQALDSAQGVAVTRFARSVGRRSNGQVTIEVYPSAQLAKEQAAIDGVATGVIDLTTLSSSFLSPVLPRIEILGAPFLFRTASAAFRVVDGQIGNELFAELEPKGILGLGWGGGSFKEFMTTSKAVTGPEDMKGMRLRSVGGQVYNAIFQALGAIPVTIDIAETYAALSNHTVDGLDAPLDSFTFLKLYVVVKNIAMTNHIFNVNPIIGSKKKIESLPPALQKIVKEEARGMASFWRNLLSKQTNDDIEFLKKNGVAFTQTQYPAFRKAMDPVYALMQNRLGEDLLNRAKRATGDG